MRIVLRLLALTAAVLSPASASAADAQPAEAAPPHDRAEAWRRLRAEKSTHLHAYVPKAAEKFAVRFEDEIIPRLTTPRSGFFPFIGRITSGGGFALGPGYRLLDVAGADWTSYGAGSLKGYWQIDSRLTWTRLAHGRAFATAYGRYFRFPREDFYGIGPESDHADRTDFDLRQGAVGFSAGVRPTPWFSVGGTTEYLRPRLGPGGDNKVPNATQVFSLAQLPGWAEQHDFVRVEGFADAHTAEPFMNPRKGGKYRVAVARYSDRSGNGRFHPRRRRRAAVLSIFNERRVFALRALGSFSDVAGEAEMPFYLMRTLGGGQTLRGFRDFRFRDRHLLAVQAVMPASRS